MHPSPPPALHVTDVSKHYGKIRGIHELNLTVPAGSLFGFIGPNGAGKTTTLRILMGLIHKDRGTVEILGTDIDRASADTLRHLKNRIGYMSSDAVTYPHMRVRQLLEFSARLRQGDDRLRAEGATLCAQLDLDPQRRIKDLSFGNRKKVSLVAGLMHRPDLIILDEPTSGLDPLIQRTFWSILKERRDEGATVLLSSHVLSEVQAHCDQAAVIRAGRIVAEGPVDQLLEGAPRRVTLSGLTPDSRTALEAFLSTHSHDLHVTPTELTALYHGQPPALVAFLADHTFSDLTFEPPRLDDVFMDTYRNGGPS